MGGSSSYPGPSTRTTDEAEKIFRSNVEDAERTQYEDSVNSYLQGLLSDFNDRNVDQINTHLDTIRDALIKENIGSINLVYGGSIKKHTYIDGLSDVDVLVTINNTALANSSPQQVLQYFAERLRDRLPNTEIKIGTLAVTVKFSDGHEIQVLPAISTGTGLRVPSSNGTDWSGVVRPDKFASKLTSVNQSNSGKVVPTIKLFKAVNAGLPKDLQLSGYHIESIAIGAFENYQGSKNYKDMLLHFAEYASKAVRNPITDSTGQSIHVDDYLGGPESAERRRVSSALEDIATSIKSADSKTSIEGWKKLV